MYKMGKTQGLFRARFFAATFLFLLLIFDTPTLAESKKRAKRSSNSGKRHYASREGGKSMEEMSFSRYTPTSISSTPLPCVNGGDTYASLLGAGGRLVQDKGDFAQAEGCFQRAALLPANSLAETAHAIYYVGRARWANKDLRGALACMEEALSIDPTHFEALISNGDLLKRAGKGSEAVSMYERAIDANPDEQRAFDALAQYYYDAKRLDDAVKVYDDMARRQPMNPEGHYLGGILTKEKGDNKGAIAKYKQALSLNPNDARYYYSLGNALSDDPTVSGEEVLQMYTTAVRINPNYSQAWNNLGNLQREMGDVRGALRSITSAIETAMNNPAQQKEVANYRINLAQSYRDLQDYHTALDLAKLSQKEDPTLPEAFALAASAYYELGDFESSVREFETAVQLRPGWTSAMKSLANALGDLYRKRETSRLKVDKDNDGQVDTFSEEEEKKLEDMRVRSLDLYKAVLRIEPNDTSAAVQLLWSQRFVCDWSEYDTSLGLVLSLINNELETGRKGKGRMERGRRKPPTVQAFQALALPLSGGQHRQICGEHARVAGVLMRSVFESVGLNLRDTLPFPSSLVLRGAGVRPRLTLGYISSYFGDHPVGHNSWFHNHDYSRVRVVCFTMEEGDRSLWYNRMKDSVDEVVDIAGMGMIDIGREVNKRGVHVLVTLNGWTVGQKMEVLAMRSAPIQLAHFGSHDTLGAPSYIHYLISDRIASPPEYESIYAEKLMITPTTFFVNEYKDTRAVVVQNLSSLPNEWREARQHEIGVMDDDTFIFANFNQLFKLDPALFKVWMRIMKRVPNSVFWLLRLPAQAEKFLKREALAAGVDPSRLRFSDRGEWTTHLRVKGAADLFLDNPIFNAHTSGCDILWAGVPMLTSPLEKMSSRVGASLVSAMRVPYLVQRTLDDYEETAVALATTDRAKLAKWREEVEENRFTSGFFDQDVWVRALERGVEQMWDMFEAGGEEMFSSSAGAKYHIVHAQQW